MAQGEDEEGEEAEESEAGEAPVLPSGAELAAAYFRSWDNPTRHLPLLQDKALSAAWSAALASAPPGTFEGKTVLEVGCGVGLLSVMAAKAGAARVIAVDGSAGAADAARRVARANGLQDRITVVHGAIQDVDLPGVAPGGVDVILSNWMGPGLLGGGMLPGLAHAVETWLRPGGLVLPDTASLWAVGLEDREALQDAKKTWGSVAGVDMTAALAQVIQHPRLDAARRKAQLLTAPQQLAQWRTSELRTGAVVDPAIGAYARCPLRLVAEREDRMFGLMLYWDAAWTFGGALGPGDGKPAVRLSTGPTAPATHYKQLVINFPRSLLLAPGDVLAGELELRPGGTDPRDLEVALRLAQQGGGAAAGSGAVAPIVGTFRVPYDLA
ncbi:hypothetical protein GPECTOR_3g151 [Gonium pectorale]|uniref:Uncharacterized protein n=1 Tax=Gonium pectorale TaxID=33097 RepID=A0A150GYL0_GONPE|nr:hypothetical protein GPECTOR_3g151 [Gonium pectorale]|eukprot:KXZ54986.1 hypothetical protein GPECTOR_3g151 [Gonium pectorale]